VYGTIFKNRGKEMFRYPYKDCSSLNRWRDNRDLLSIFTFCNLFSATTHLRQGKKVNILVPGDVNSDPLPRGEVCLRQSLSCGRWPQYNPNSMKMVFSTNGNGSF
jgi:hypothetical protein